MPALAEARSPYALLDEVGTAREVLILTYTAGLDFFERFALSNARALGARVTVISDATMVRADPMVVRRAGTQYLDARAVCPQGAFHPKLIVIVGETEARVAVGSGNLTIAGWHGNAETWTVLRGDTDGGPVTLRQVAAFLRDLAGSTITLSAGADRALARVADTLDQLPADQPGPQLLSSLTTPIEVQLPPMAAPVAALVLYAPFHGAKLAASRALLDRFQPQKWTMYVREDTEIDGEQLQALVNERGGRVAWVSRTLRQENGKAVVDERYWHGKVVQWQTADELFALVGSPNLSRRALLQTVADGGNCELALLTTPDRPLTPQEGEAPAGGVATLTRPAGVWKSRPAVLILAAIVNAATVTIQLHARLPGAGVVQLYDLDGDQWRTTAPITAGADHYDLDIAQAPVGRAIRIVIDDPAVVSNSVFVADLNRVTRPQTKAIGKLRLPPEDIARDGLGQQLLADLDLLHGHLLLVGAAASQAKRATADNNTDYDDGETAEPARAASGMTLEEFLLACEPVLGQRMTEFALVLPALPGVGVALDDTVGTLDTDNDDTAPTEPLDGPVTITDELNRRTSSERTRYRQFVERLIERSPTYPVIVRTLALRTLIHAIAANLWESKQWPELLSNAIDALTAADDLSIEPALGAAASLATVALALLRTDVPRFSRRDEHLIRYEQTGNTVKELLRLADPQQVEALAKELPGRLQGAPGVLAAERATADILNPLSGMELAVRLLADESNEDATVEDGVTIVLASPVPPQFEPKLAQVLGLARDEGPVYVRAVTAAGRKVLGGWAAPLIAFEQVGPAGPYGRAWNLLKGQTPSMLTADDFSRPDYSWFPNRPRPKDVEDVLGEIHPGPAG